MHLSRSFNLILLPISDHLSKKSGLLKGALYKKIFLTSLLVLLLLGKQTVTAASAPSEVTGVVYSRTAAEVFWPRVGGQVVAYAVSRNGEELGVFDALSYFDDTLESDKRYVYSVASVETDGTRNWADLPETLPCPISPFGAALQEECR